MNYVDVTLLLTNLAFFCFLIFLYKKSPYNAKPFFLYFDIIKKKDKFLFALMPFSLLLIFWELLYYSKLINSVYLPSPYSTFKELGLLILDHEFIFGVGISLFRIISAFFVASLFGVIIGSIAGTFEKIRLLALPLNSAFRYIPPTAFISLIIIWFGIGEFAKISLIFIAIIFYIIQMTSDVVKLTPKVYVNAAKMLGYNRYQIFKNVTITYSLPEIISVLRVNLGAAWTFLIVSELVASQNGLGFLIATSQRFLLTSKLFALLLILGLLGYISDSLLGLLIKKIGHWRQ